MNSQESKVNEKLLLIHERNLRILLCQAANLGKEYVPPYILNKIEDELTEIEELCKELGRSLTSDLNSAYRLIHKPDNLIDNLNKVSKPLLMDKYDIFICYSSQDEKIARKIYRDLIDKGFKCWFASEDMRIGERIRYIIDEALLNSDKFLIILSNNSIHSQWVEHEVELAFEKERNEKATNIIPIMIDNFIMSKHIGWANLIKNTRNIGDFSNWRNSRFYQLAFDRLLRDLKVNT